MSARAEVASASGPPESLLVMTCRAGSGRRKDVGVSPQVASMVLREEARTRWVRTASSMMVLVVLLLIFGLSQVARTRKADASELSRLAADGPKLGRPSPARSWSSWIPGMSPATSCPNH